MSNSRTIQTHYFDSSGDAYDEVQCSDDIKNGDLLVIKSERVVGIANTWPFAVTKECGQLHSEDGVDIENDESFAKWKVSIMAAKAVMLELGFD